MNMEEKYILKDIERLIRVYRRSKNELGHSYFQIIKRAIDINLERVFNEPKINIRKYIFENWSYKLTANQQLEYWYDVKNPVRNLIELGSDDGVSVFDNGWKVQPILKL